MGISIDGALPQTHDEFRGIPGAFERIIQGVKNCIEEGIDVCIATVMHRDNLAEIEKILQLVKELGVRFMHFNYIPTGRAKEHVELDLTPMRDFMFYKRWGRRYSAYIFGLKMMN